jgi:hypothetical protein
MYCYSCGIECAAGLSYCNRCGANLNPAGLATQVTQVVQVGNLTKPVVALSLTTLGVSLGGLALVFVAAGEIASMHIGQDSVIATIVLGMLFVLITTIMLIRQLSRIITATLQPKAVAPAQPQPPQFAPAERSARQLANAPPDYITPSVTEHTTRALYKEPRM